MPWRELKDRDTRVREVGGYLGLESEESPFGGAYTYFVIEM